jgi:hypothetical protein
LRIALLVRGDAPFQALEAALAIDGSDVRVVAVRPLLAARGALVQAHQSEQGRLAVALATAAPIGAGARAGIIVDLAAPAGTPRTVALDRLSVE